jgi:hypothetical protein
MAWPNRAYVATTTLGLYYTAAFGTPGGAQPTWAALNTGLDHTDLIAFCLDTHEATHDTRMFAIEGTDYTLYRRTTGNWASILTSAAAQVLAGFADGAVLRGVCVDPVTGYVYALLGGLVGTFGTAVLISADHGDNWSAVTIRASAYTYAVGNIDAYNGLVVTSQTGSPLRCRSYYSTNHGGTWSYFEVQEADGGTTLAQRIHPDVANTWYGGAYAGVYLFKATAAGTYSILSNADYGLYTAGGMWIDPNDADHMATLQVPTNTDWKETLDDWVNLDVHQATNVILVYEVAEHSEDNCWVHGCIQPTDSAPARAPLYTSTDGHTLTTRSGTNWNTAPYTDAIPVTCGGITGRGLWVVFDPPTEGPTPPPGSTITPPGGTQITLGGTANVQAVTMPGNDGENQGVPLPGDRSAFNDVDYPELHGLDLKRALPTVHNPWPMAAGEAAVSDGTKLVATDITTAAELATHTADVDAHHAPITLGAGSDAALGLAGQELTLADVLTPAEHTAIGTGAPHHVAVTLGGGSDPALALVGQALTLTLPPVSAHYRMYVYGIVAGDFDFVRDVDGYPVTSLEDTE